MNGNPLSNDSPAELEQTATRASNRLPILAAEIQRAHRAAQQAATRALDHALDCGKGLAEAKASLPHGRWLPWLAENCSISERQTQKYLRLHHLRDELSNPPSKADFTIDGALAALAASESDILPNADCFLISVDPVSVAYARIYPSRDCPGLWHYESLGKSGPFEFSRRPLKRAFFTRENVERFIVGHLGWSTPRPPWQAIPLEYFEPMFSDEERDFQ